MMVEKQNDIEEFWKTYKHKERKTLLDLYLENKAPIYITQFISLGGGPKMGVTLEKFARFRFKTLQERPKGQNGIGYDHIVDINGKKILIEQKSSTRWGGKDFRWQHIEGKHPWNILLFCGIDYDNVKFWMMNRSTFDNLISEKKITNQGNKNGNSTEGVWCKYSDIENSLTEINNDEEIMKFCKKNIQGKL